MHKDVEGLIGFREAEEGDRAYIHSSWIKGMSSSYATLGLAPHQWLPVQRSIIRHCLDYAEVRMAHLIGDETAVVGYIIWDGAVLHWINVKHIFRGYGVAKEMMKRFGQEIRYYSHTPPAATQRKQNAHKNKKDSLKLIYHPFFILEHYYDIKDRRIISASAHSREGRDGVVFGSEKVSGSFLDDE